jgi:hypothetical protein
VILPEEIICRVGRRCRVGPAAPRGEGGTAGAAATWGGGAAPGAVPWAGGAATGEQQRGEEGQGRGGAVEPRYSVPPGEATECAGGNRRLRAAAGWAMDTGSCWERRRFAQWLQSLSYAQTAFCRSVCRITAGDSLSMLIVRIYSEKMYYT